MRASGVNAAIMRAIGKLEQKQMRAIGNARIGVSRIMGFYCILVHFNFKGTRRKRNTNKISLQRMMFRLIQNEFIFIICKYQVDSYRIEFSNCQIIVSVSEIEFGSSNFEFCSWQIKFLGISRRLGKKALFF